MISVASRASFTGIATLSLLLFCCGYQSMQLGHGALDIARVRTGGSDHVVSLCLERALESELSMREGGTSVGEVQHRLEVELLDLNSTPSTIARRDGELEVVEQETSFAVNARLRTISEGTVVWGPVVFRLEQQSNPGATVLDDRGILESSHSRGCRRVARQIIDDVLVFILSSED